LTEHPWRSLGVPKDASEVSARRVNESSKWDFYWARDMEGRSLLVMNHNAASTPRERLPRLRGVEVFIHPDEDSGRQSLALRLLDSSLRDLFETLCLDIVASTEASASEREAVGTALARTWRWHHLLRGGGGGLLSAEEQKGLIGELLVLERYVVPLTSPSIAVAAWRGPLGEPKDFVIGRTGIESKARSTATASTVHISSEFQLADAETDAIFLHLSVLDSAEPDDDRGFTVTEIVLRVRDRLGVAGDQTVERFNALLAAAGFRFEDDYTHWRWHGGERSIYVVQDTFPRLTPDTIPAGVSNATYALSLGFCGAFLVEPSVLESAVAGAARGN
jgi:Putative  PD-(D/E)XK family member, (DUF4420)